MTARTDKGGESVFYHALAALLFLAASAWLGAALYARLSAAPEQPAESEQGAVPIRFSGLLLRREEPLEAGAFAGTEEGARLPAAETGTESALYFLGCDGWEALSPADAEPLTPKKLDALLAFAPAEADENAPRLVYGFELCLAAFLEGGAARPGPCRLRLENVAGEVSGRVLTVEEDAGRTALLLRLTEIPEELYRLRFVRGEIV